MSHYDSTFTAEHGSCALTYTPNDYCGVYDDFGGEPCTERPIFRWDQGEYSDWNGGSRLCLRHAREITAERIAEMREWGDEGEADKFEAEIKRVLELAP